MTTFGHVAGLPKECNRQVCYQHLEVLEPTESITELFLLNLPPVPCPVSESPHTTLGHTDPGRLTQEFVFFISELCHHARHAHSPHLRLAGM